MAIIRKLRPDQELVVRPRWLPVGEELFDAADAVVLCGGPGLGRRFYPSTFPLVEDLEAHPTAVLPLALGWSGQEPGRRKRFFSRQSIDALRTIHQRIGWSGVRDDLSLKILHDAAVGEARRTGCVAWYDLESLGGAFDPPARVRRLVFTPPSRRKRGGLREAVGLLRRLRGRFRAADRYCVFHRGMRAEFENEVPTRERWAIAAAARALGYTVVDASGRLSAIEFYRTSDLHVGYRVHAHLCFLSYRRPSLLLIEDGRGDGQATTLDDPYLLRTGDDGLLDKVDDALFNEQREGFPASARAVEEIERTWPVMRQTVEQLPGG